MVRVVPDLAAGTPAGLYDYAVPEPLRGEVRPGQRVVVPFGRRRVFAYVLELLEASPHAALKDVESIRDHEPLLQEHQLELAHWIADYYLCPLAEVVRAMVPPGLRSGRPGGRPRAKKAPGSAAGTAGKDRPALTLTAAQEEAFAPIRSALDGGSGGEFLLFGVTGAGKTEVYLAAIRRVIDLGRDALLLIPEISLTPQTVRRFSSHFPGQLAVLHSGLTPGQRAGEWRRVRRGDARVVVGSRSAVFAPLPGLGLIIVDEEDSTSYKQYDRTPRYHAVTVARALGRLLSVPVVLGSATPTLESYDEARRKEGGPQMLRLPGRFAGRPLPPVEIVDLRAELAWGNRSPLSRRLEQLVSTTLSEQGQAILFLNRRGTSSVVLCRSCGEALGCPNCSVSLTLHARERGCTCHYCGYQLDLPDSCPSCGSRLLRALGAGTERLEAEAKSLWPNARILRMDRDTVSHRDAHREIYEAFADREADLLIGTQMVAKGWDLPGVRLVGIVNADIALHFPDFRASERTFSLLTQVAGRAGRGDEPAQVVLQTYSPEHPAVTHASAHDYEGFASLELRARGELGFPPYSRLLVLTRSGAIDQRVQAEAQEVALQLGRELAGAGIEVLGPSPAFIPRLRSLYRWQVTLRGPDLSAARPLLPSGPGWAVDVDPS